MSISVYVQMTKLTNVKGRINYAMSPESQQEKLIGVAGNQDKKFWRLLAKDCQAAFTEREVVDPKTGTAKKDKCCEAREAIIYLPNCIEDLSEKERQKVLDELSEFLKEITGTDNCLALHDSHAKDKEKPDIEQNYHIHAILAEREWLEEPMKKIAERNLFYDEQGKRRYKKADILDAEGNLREGCQIVPKGTVLHTQHFSEKNSEMKEKYWTHELKQQMADWINDRLQPDKKRVVFDRSGPYLAQVKIPNWLEPEDAAERREENRLVKIFNAAVRNGTIPEDIARDVAIQINLAPDRSEALKAALLELQGRPGPQVSVAGGDRTRDTGERENLKQQLRQAYEDAATWRKRAREANSVDRKIYLVEARKCSAQIDRLKAQLGYSTSKEQQQAIERTQALLKKNREWQTALRHRKHYLIRRKKKLSEIISNVRSALFRAEEDGTNYAKIDRLATQLGQFRRSFREVNEALQENRALRAEAAAKRKELKDMLKLQRKAPRTERSVRGGPGKDVLR